MMLDIYNLTIEHSAVAQARSICERYGDFEVDDSDDGCVTATAHIPTTDRERFECRIEGLASYDLYADGRPDDWCGCGDSMCATCSEHGYLL